MVAAPAAAEAPSPIQVVYSEYWYGTSPSVCVYIQMVQTFGLVTPRLKRFTVLIRSWHYKLTC